MTATSADPAPPRPQVFGAEERLPDGWEIAEYTGRGGRAFYAVYLNGRRMASGMPSTQSAARWARLLATAA